MPAYLISLDPEGEWYSDEEGVAAYGRNVPAIVESFGGRYLLARRAAEVLEGGWDPGPVVLIEFPTRADLDAFYQSDVYRPWLELRKRAGLTRMVVVEQ